jgi:hypothetical protein
VESRAARRRFNWRRILNPLRFAVSGGLLVFLILYADPLEIWEVWKNVDLRWLALAFLLQLVGIALSAAKWNVILAARGKQQPYSWALGTYLVGQFANNFLPTTVGGDALRAMQLGRRIGSYSQSSASIFIERLTGFLALSLIAVLALTVSYIQVTGTALVTEPWLLWVAAGFAVLAVGAAVASLLAPWLHNMLGGYLPRATHDPLKKVAGALADYFPQGKSLAVVIAMSLLFQSTWVLIHVVCGKALNIDAPVLLYALMVPLTDMLGLLPIFVNSVGARETIFILYLTQVPSVDAATAISLAFMIFTIRLTASALGGLVTLFGGADLRIAGVGRGAKQEPQAADEPERADIRVASAAHAGPDAASREW